MAKLLKRLAVFTGMAITIAGCQSFNTLHLKKVKETEQTKSNALIYCDGTKNCEFERLGKTRIVDANNHRLQKEAIQQGIVRLNKASLNDDNAIYLSVPAAQYELVVRFYPISEDKAETLHLIHRFNANRQYRLNMFRDRSKNRGSLLNSSAPDPLCVDLQQNMKTIRRFCKPYNVLNGLGEFVEQKNFKTR